MASLLNPISIIHIECGKEAFKYMGDTSPGKSVEAKYVTQYHPDHTPVAPGYMICKSCNKTLNTWDLHVAS